MKPVQLQLIKNIGAKEFGGTTRCGKRKIARPIATKKPMHLVFRSSRARGQWSLLHKQNKGLVHEIVLDVAERFGVKVHKYENVGNHIHLLAQVKKRENLRAFLRVLPQRIMFSVTGARKGNPVGRFWDVIVYSRIVEWGREFKAVKHYIWKNTMEVLGFRREELLVWREVPS